MNKKLLILDIDQTLINSTYLPSNAGLQYYDFKLASSDHGYDYFVVKRPYLKEFIEWAFENFNIAIWTAAESGYAMQVLENIGISVENLDFFYTEKNCVIKMDYDTGEFYGVKNLSKIRKSYNLDEVLIVDDVRLTAINNYGNLINIKPFNNEMDDMELLKLISYLDKIKSRTNFRNIDKRAWSTNG